MLEENCNLAEERVSCLEGELRDVSVIADDSAMKFDEVEKPLKSSKHRKNKARYISPPKKTQTNKEHKNNRESNIYEVAGET